MDLDVDLYVNAKCSSMELARQLHGVLGGRIDVDSVVGEAMEAFIEPNTSTYPDPQDDFLNFPFIVGLEPREGMVVDADQFVETVAQVMKRLAAFGATVTAACDFEDRLPGGGSIDA